MKKLLFIFIAFLSLESNSQVIADPATSQVSISSLADASTNASAIPLDQVFKLNIPLYNFNLLNQLPSGTCKIKIGLGSKMVLDPTFDISTITPGNYFEWTSETSGGQVQITGNLVFPLPSNYSNIAKMRVKGSILGSSTITANFLVTNHNSTTTLSDENPSNNNSSLAYIIVAPVPVTFTGLNLLKKDCQISVNFFTEQEVNVLKYEVETSRDGIHFVKDGELSATNNNRYSYNLSITESNKAQTLIIRIKSIDRDGRFQFSGSKSVSGLCENKQSIFLYPNPMQHNNQVMNIASRNGTFDGSFIITILNLQGQVIDTYKLMTANTNTIQYRIGNLSAGKYFLRLRNSDGTYFESLQFEKL